MQDAVETALSRWPVDGVPQNPAAWLTTAAYRRALDVLRRRRIESTKLQQVAALSDPGPTSDADPFAGGFHDDELRLLFTCCHPALPLAGRVALTLKTVGGLSVRQIAKAFLVSEATMSQRLLRARNKLEHAGIQLKVPAPHRLAERTAGVLAVVYLIFNEGYGATDEAGRELAAEAVRLADLITRLLPDDDEAQGLYALLLLQHARREARTDEAGDLVPMEEQDRGRWDHAMLVTALSMLERTRATGRPAGSYRLQAEIAAVHVTSRSAAETDWDQVVAGYDALSILQPTPIVAFNRAIAVGFRDGPAAGLLELAQVAHDPRLATYHLLPAARADLLRRAGRSAEAAVAYREALALTRTAADSRFLERRLTELQQPG